MSIVKMKRTKLIALSKDRKSLLKELMRLGSVEITETAELLKEQEWAEIAGFSESAAPQLRASAAEIDAALGVLNKYNHEKKSAFAPRPTISVAELFDTDGIKEALTVAGEINELVRRVTHSYAEEHRLINRRTSLIPWESLKAPLDVSSSRAVAMMLGVCPATAIFERLSASLVEAAPLSELYLIHSDKEQHYLMLICHKSDYDNAMITLKHAGFSQVMFKDAHGTAGECIRELDREKEEIITSREDLKQTIASYGSRREMLQYNADRIAQELAREQAQENILNTKEAFFFEGWAVASETDKLTELFNKYDCWYEFADPAEDDDVPIRLDNKGIVEPFGLVIEMYGFPQYKNIDPTPLITPFFGLFFGIMYGDVGYGLILLAAGIFITKKLKPRGIVGQMFRLFRIVGVTSIFFGIIYGSFFGDSIEAVARTFFGAPETFSQVVTVGGIPVFGAFNMLSDPLMALILALSIGVVHIITGMGIKAYILCRDGRPLDALMDVGSWWVTFAGIGLFVAGYGYVVLLCGAAALVLTQGRRSKSIFGKAAGGLASLYNIMTLLSDVLSYSRLMALALASSVIAMVFNIIAELVGGVPFVGIVLFALIFLVGHTFNMGINLIGTAVHGARLQYLEYFKQFYEGGGPPFKPLEVKTRFVDII